MRGIGHYAAAVCRPRQNGACSDYPPAGQRVLNSVAYDTDTYLKEKRDQGEYVVTLDTAPNPGHKRPLALATSHPRMFGNQWLCQRGPYAPPLCPDVVEPPAKRTMLVAPWTVPIATGVTCTMAEQIGSSARRKGMNRRLAIVVVTVLRTGMAFSERNGRRTDSTDPPNRRRHRCRI